MEWMMHDLRLSLRLLTRDKAFSLTATLTLALCIGANTALFSVVHHVLLRPLPVPEPERILIMRNSYPKAGAGDMNNSGVPDYFDRLRDVSVFDEQALFNGGSVGIGQEGAPVRVRVQNVTPSFFRLMRVPAAQGRTFTQEEGEIGQEKKVVLSDRLWRSQLGADPAAVGRNLRLDGEAYTVVGVMPPSFEALSPGVSLWRPLAFTAEQKSDSRRHSNNWENLGRLKPGATREQAQAQVDALNAANMERFPQYSELLTNAGFHSIVDSYADRLVKDVKPTLYLLWGGAFFVLLIGCVNVTNLVLVRTRARLKELATRLALGAGPWQVARQLVAENLILALVAAIAGLAIGAFALQALSSFDMESLPHAAEIRLDGASVLYALALSSVIGFVMGVLPVLAVLPGSLSTVLREEGRASTGGRGARSLRRTLVVAQMAFTFILLVGAGLLLASFRKVLEIDPGFVSDRVHTASVALPRTRYPEPASRVRFTDEALRAIRALPGVKAAGATDTIPFGGSHSDSVILAEGYQMKPGESVLSPNAVEVSAGYFETMGVKLVRGRFIGEADVQSAPRVIVVDEKLAERFWPGGDPVGRRMYFPNDINDLLAVTKDTVFMTVVGVVRGMKLQDLTEGEKVVGTYFVPMAQYASSFMTFAVKTAGPGTSVPGELRSAVAALDRELPVFDAQTMEVRTQKSLLNRRSPALLSLSFGIVALLLSAVGIYGVLAYLVTQRKREIGIRIALGSSARAIFDLVIREGVILVGTGFLVGALGAFLLRRSLESQLFGVRAADPWVVGGVSALLAVVALLACALPARRATRIDPRAVLAE